jgi:hypothetical protein
LRLIELTTPNTIAHVNFKAIEQLLSAADEH